MKTKVSIFVLLSFLLVSCFPATPTQEDEVVEIVTDEVVTEEPISQPIATEESVVTEEPTETPIACVTLLSPVDGVEIPNIGKATFSWTAMDEAGKYILNIILPTGDVVTYEVDEVFHDQYMEGFTMGGEFQWQVVAQGIDGSEICVSDIAKFEKSAYNPPKSNNSGGGDDGDNGSSGSGWCIPGVDWGCEGGGGTE